MPIGMAALIVLLAVVAAVGWSNTLHEQRLLGWHQNMLSGAAAAPDQYRILTPFLADAVFWLKTPVTIEQTLMALRHAYLAVHATALLVAGLFFFAFCRNWLKPSGALLCVALLMALCAVANLRGQIQVADPLNLMFVTMGLWAIQREKMVLLLAAVLVGALNRESVLVLAGYYVLMQWPQPRGRILLTGLLLTLAWGISYGALRLGYGMRAYYVDVVMLGYNIESFLRWAPPLLLLGPLALAALMRHPSRWPGPLRRATLVIPPHLLLHLVVARLEEVRLFIPLLPVLIPLAVLGIANEDAREVSTSEDQS